MWRYRLPVSRLSPVQSEEKWVTVVGSTTGCLHIRLLIWHYCRLSPGVSTLGRSILPPISRCLHTRPLNTATYLPVSPHQVDQPASLPSTLSALFCLPTPWVLFQKNVLSAFYLTTHHLKRFEPSITYCGHCQSMTAVTRQLLAAAVQNVQTHFVSRIAYLSHLSVPASAFCN
jgi:hypothetical protein